MRQLYKRLLPYETRFWLYKLRNPKHFQKLRYAVYPSPKGDFSLRSFSERECLFVHITKSAGTSIAKSLFGELPYHYTASQYRVIYGRKLFNRYFKFTFVRNPWDRLYSAYSYLEGGGWNDKDAQWAKTNLGSVQNFEEFVLNWLTPERLNSHVHFWPQHRFICNHKGRVLLDYIAYYETIEEDFNNICKQLNIQADLEHTNKSLRNDYKEVYTAEMILKVQSLYQRDINLLGYSFNTQVKPALNKNNHAYTR